MEEKRGRGHRPHGYFYSFHPPESDGEHGGETCELRQVERPVEHVSRFSCRTGGFYSSEAAFGYQAEAERGKAVGANGLLSGNAFYDRLPTVGLLAPQLHVQGAGTAKKA